MVDPSAPMIRLGGLRLNLVGASGEVNVLRGVDLEIAAGESVSVTGPSGSGKSSLMMVVGGLERPSAGSVVVAGQDLAILNEDGLARWRRDHVGIVFQSFHLIATMTALENVALPLELGGEDQAFERAREQLGAVGLGARVGHYPGQLSGGEQQRVALARAFVVRPALLLADEPTGNLDGATGRQVMDLIFSLSRRYATTLFLVTHDPALAARCDRTVQMTDGLIESGIFGSGVSASGVSAGGALDKGVLGGATAG